jgi:hypothetical protein
MLSQVHAGPGAEELPIKVMRAAHFENAIPKKPCACGKG